MARCDECATVVRAKGCPGGGKTYWIFETLAELIETEDIEWSDVYVLTFARASTAEATDRLVELFGADTMSSSARRNVERRAKTVHGAACSAALAAGVIDDVEDQVIDPINDADVYRRFCEQNALTYARRERDPLKIAHSGQTVEHSGNQLFGVYQWLKLTRRPHSQLMKAPVTRPAGPTRTKKLLNAWDDFKRDGEANGQGVRLFEHADYVDEVIDGHHVPNARILFIDEFQDLSPQEYLLIKRWRDSGEIDRMYIAGDAAQSIYSFRAAEPDYFRKTPVDDEVDLTMSRRCPGAIAAVANGTLRGWGSAYSADPHIRAQRGGGIATRERITTPDDLAKRVIDEERTYEPNDDGYTMFLLSRTNRQVGKLSSALDANGIPYDVISSKDHQQPWSDPLPLLFKALRLIGQGRDIRHAPHLIPDTFGKYYAGDAETTTELADRHVEDVIARLTRTPDTRGRYKLTQRERDRLRNAIENDITTDPGRYSKRVRVGTIHSAKGLEAPCVYLFDGYTAKTRKAYYSSKATAAEEHRLYYVGVTRASQKLIVATGYKNMGTSVFPGFENGLPRNDRTVVVENEERDGADGDEEVAA